MSNRKDLNHELIRKWGSFVRVGDDLAQTLYNWERSKRQTALSGFGEFLWDLIVGSGNFGGGPSFSYVDPRMKERTFLKIEDKLAKQIPKMVEKRLDTFEFEDVEGIEGSQTKEYETEVEVWDVDPAYAKPVDVSVEVTCPEKVAISGYLHIPLRDLMSVITKSAKSLGLKIDPRLVTRLDYKSGFMALFEDVERQIDKAIEYEGVPLSEKDQERIKMFVERNGDFDINTDSSSDQAAEIALDYGDFGWSVSDEALLVEYYNRSRVGDKDVLLSVGADVTIDPYGE